MRIPGVVLALAHCARTGTSCFSGHRKALLVAGMAFCALAAPSRPVRSEVPLPAATLFGTVRSETGTVLSSGDLRGILERDGATLLELSATFENDGQGPVYVLRIPLESDLGIVGGSAGPAAREGDVLARLVLDGQTLIPAAALPEISIGLLARVDATLPGGAVESLFRGDCNGDLELDVGDPVMSLFFLFVGNVTPPCIRSCDADASQAVDVSDAVFLLQYIFLRGPAPAPPGPRCGPDPAGGAGPPCAQRSCAAGG